MASVRLPKRAPSGDTQQKDAKLETKFLKSSLRLAPKFLVLSLQAGSSSPQICHDSVRDLIGNVISPRQISPRTSAGVFCRSGHPKTQTGLPPTAGFVAILRLGKEMSTKAGKYKWGLSEWGLNVLVHDWLHLSSFCDESSLCRWVHQDYTRS